MKSPVRLRYPKTHAAGAVLMGIVVAACGVTPPQVWFGAQSPGPVVSAQARSTSTAVGSAPAAQSAPTSSATPPARTPSPGNLSLPDFSHVYLIVMENKEGSSIIDNPAAPYINGLAHQYGLAANYSAVGHPSEPNYLVLVSGSTNGVTDDGIYNLAARSVFDEIDASGRTWHVAEQNDRGGCFTGSTSSGGPDGPGTYARKHNPAISFTSISTNPALCARITDLHSFDLASASFNWVEPNLCNSMHDCSIATGDGWLASFLPGLLASNAYRSAGVIFLTWDEGSSNLGGGGRVATIVISPLAKAGFTSVVAHDHYSLLRTIQDAWGLPCLAHTCSANDLRELFR
jgi:phosphatidylinositol-3-phosphatase